MANAKYDNLLPLLASGRLNWPADKIQAVLMENATFNAAQKRLSQVTGLPRGRVALPERMVRPDDGSLLGFPVSFDAAVADTPYEVLVVKDDGINDPLLLSWYDTANDAVAGTGQFRFDGSQIISPDGRQFKPKGLNVGTDFATWYPPTYAYTQGGAAMVVQPGHFEDHSVDMLPYGLNMIRLNIQDGLEWASAIDRIQTVIDAYTARKIVVLLDPHDEYGESPTFATWLASWAPGILGPVLDANKTNPYVWIAPGNEEYHNGVEESQWLAYHVGFYDWVRSSHVAPNTVIVADAMNYAQDMSHTSTYASLVGSGRTGQVIGWHNYGGDYQSADGQYHVTTEATWDAWMQASQNAGIPVQIHEFGQAWDPNDHSDHTYPGSDANERQSVAWILNQWDAYKGMGGLAWHGTGANDSFNVRAVNAVDWHGAWYDTTYPLSDWGSTFFAKTTSDATRQIKVTTPGSLTVRPVGSTTATPGVWIEFEAQAVSYAMVRPFSADSPYNTPFPADTQWFDSHTLHFEPNGDVRHWWAQADPYVGCRVWIGNTKDPLWTFNMPDYIAGPPFNRNRPAQTFTMHGPPTLNEDHTSDHLVLLIDQSTGQYVEVWNAQVDTVSRIVTGVPNNMGWATGSVIDGLGAGNPGGKNAGVRATNTCWIAGMISGRDIAHSTIDHALAIAAPGSMFAASLVRWPATSPDTQGSGPQAQGTRFGIPAGVSMPSGLTTIGQMAFQAIQTYGMYLLDYAGAERPVIAVDMNTVTDAQVRGLYADWEMPGSMSDMDRIAPLMRVADYNPGG